MAEPLVDRIAQAIGDPGSIVGRKLGPSWGKGNDGYAEQEETVTRWSARAVAAVLREIERNGRYSASVDIKNMPPSLGDEGWAELERNAVEADYPPRWVRDRRRRDDFTTATIECAYQYGYRKAAKVAYGAGGR